MRGARYWSRRARALVVRRYRRLQTPTLAEGALTFDVISRRCVGFGVEIGPGDRPECVRYRAPGQTVVVDRWPDLEAWAEYGMTVGARADAAHLPFANGAFDYLISAHCLEHCPDVLSALAEWRRVLKDGGALVLVLPHVDRSFDRGRPVATYDHHAAEHGKGGDGLDDEHWIDFEAFSIPNHQPTWLDDEGAHRADGSLDREYLAAQGFVHFHAWTQNEMVEILLRSGFHIRDVAEELPQRPNSFLIAASVARDEDARGSSRRI